MTRDSHEDTRNTHTIATRTHGRYLVEPPPGAGPFPVLVGFHGYGEHAAHMLDQLRALDPERGWLLVSVQALNRFYARGGQVVGSWMTTEGRELAIADNLAYVAEVLTAVRREYATRQPVVYVGFSQGVAMAYRAAARAGHRCAALVVLAGDVPPDVAADASALPPVLLGRGSEEEWYTAQKAQADVTLLQGAGVPVTEHVFDGGHVWHESFVARARGFLQDSLRS